MTPPINNSSYRSPNYNDRPPGMAIDSLCIHTTEGAFPGDIKWLCNPGSGVSCHYVVSPEGTIYEIVSPTKRAWHAGDSSYAGRSDYNDFSIGIEVSHVDNQAYGSNQIPAVTELCSWLVKQHPIARTYVVMHRQVAIPYGRKADPTDVSDQQFSAWADRLFAPAPPAYWPIVILGPCTILQGPSPTAPMASGPNNGHTWLGAGVTVNCDQVNNGWAHVSDSPFTSPGIGFICEAYQQRA